MKLPVLGTFGNPSDPDDLTIDVDKLLGSRLLLQAQSGAGKSWALRRILEQTYGLCQQLIIDPEGEFATLRTHGDYVLAARQGGDVLASPRTAKLLAEKLLELRVSAILDLYELQVHERVQFVRFFLEALVNVRKELWHPALVVVDEAHSFCPQTGEAESAAAVIDLCARGRKRGFAALLATQRLSKLDKDAAAECANKLIGRSTLDVDIKRAADELGFATQAEKLVLRTLPTGEFFSYGPALGKTSEVRRVRIGPVVTKHPKAGERSAANAPAPSEKVKGVLAQLADLPAEAEAREKTTVELRKEVAALKAQLKRADVPRTEVPGGTVADPEKEKLIAQLRADNKKLQQLAAASIEKKLERLRTLSADALATIAASVTKIDNELLKPLQAIQLRTAANVERRPAAVVKMAPPVPRGPAPQARGPAQQAGENGDEPLTGPEQRILDALAWLARLGVSPAATAAVAFLANYVPTGGAFNNPKGHLNKLGLIRYLPNNQLQLTEAGQRLASWPAEMLSTEELHRRVLERLPGPEQRLLQPLLAVWPKALSNEQLAAQASYEPTGGAFNNPKGRLRSLGLIDYPEKGFARATDILFLPDVADQ